jgi:hypothetical protein
MRKHDPDVTIYIFMNNAQRFVTIISVVYHGASLYRLPQTDC